MAKKKPGRRRAEDYVDNDETRALMLANMTPAGRKRYLKSQAELAMRASLIAAKRVRHGTKHRRKVHRKGRRFGRMRVLSDTGLVKRYGKRSFALILVQCDCGTVEYRVAGTL